jgi:hypothetical protein
MVSLASSFLVMVIMPQRDWRRSISIEKFQEDINFSVRMNIHCVIEGRYSGIERIVRSDAISDFSRCPR